MATDLKMRRLFEIDKNTGRMVKRAKPIEAFAKEAKQIDCGDGRILTAYMSPGQRLNTVKFCKRNK